MVVRPEGDDAALLLLVVPNSLRLSDRNYTLESNDAFRFGIV